MTPEASPVQVAILALPESTASVIYGMYDLFKSAGRDWQLIVDGAPGAVLMQPQVVSSRSGAFTAGNGVRIAPDALLDDCARPDIVCVPELLVAPNEPIAGRYEIEIEWLKRRHAAGATIATVCSGAILLAEAGLLRGCEATTHWAYAEVLKTRYPGIEVRTQKALVVSGEGQRLVMAGGGTSFLDLALYLIARTCGIEIAMQVARINLIDWHDIGQQPFARLARSRQSQDAAIAECQIWIAQNYHIPSPVGALVKRSGLPERSFKRRFQQATGMAPLEYIHTLRLEEAKQMLEACDAAVEAIAGEVGYEDAGFFGRLFKRQVGLTPAQYRRRFGSMRRALTGLSSGNAASEDFPV